MKACIHNRAWSHEVRMKSEAGRPPSSPLYFLFSYAEKRGREEAWRFEPLLEQNARRRKRRDGGGVSRETGTLADQSDRGDLRKEKKNINPWWKIEIILIRSDCACQWSMQTISVVTKLCGCYWACSVSRAAPAPLFGEGKVTSPGCAAASSARSGLPGFCTRSLLGGGVGVRAFFFFFSLFPALFVWKYCSTVLLRFGLKTGHEGFKAKTHRPRARST